MQLCADRLDEKFPGKGYLIGILQGVPFFLKGLIQSKIKAKVPDKFHSRYFIFYEGRELWEKAAQFSKRSESDAYVVGFSNDSKTSEVTYRFHGNCGSDSLDLITMGLKKVIK